MGSNSFTLTFSNGVNNTTLTTNEAIVAPTTTTTYTLTSIQSGACMGIVQGKATVEITKKPILKEARFTLDGASNLILINIKELLKDSTKNIHFTITPPMSGTAEIQNGRFIAFDRAEIKEAQTVEIPYQVCSSICPTLCEKSRLWIDVEAVEAEKQLLNIPKIIVVSDRSAALMSIEGIDLIENNECLIVDRWGTPVFGPKTYRNNDPDSAWDATKKGKPLPNGAYYYFIQDKDKKILKKPFTGIVYLVDGL